MPKQVSLDEAIAIAITLQKNDRLEDAERLYQKILAIAPDHPVALHYSGVLAQQQGRSEQAVALIHRSLEADPGNADWYSNLGIALRAAGRPSDAMFAYRQAIALDPRHARAHNNLGILLKSSGSYAEAEAEYRAAVDIDPDYAEAYHNLGTLLFNQARTPEAVACFHKVVVLSPETTVGRRLLALAYCALGERQKAVDIYERWLREEPDHPVALHMLAACSGQNVPERASDQFVEQCFDEFAPTFDERLAGLGYQAPQLVAAMLREAGLEPTRTLDVLDAGCGTGLCGSLVRPYARRLVGVDLSAAMLAEARRRNVYDELCKGELTEYLHGHADSFDVIVSADTLVYFGSLNDAVAAAAAALRPRGWLVFTVEEWEATADAPPVETQASGRSVADIGYELRVHGRYAHRREYVEDVLGVNRFDAVIARAELRMESGLPVKGLLVRAHKRARGPAARGGVSDE